ncbi:MAG: LysM peptidoglycan-binding domain-containing protein [Deltaproteobacteria bacterium]|nr:LysM peptidoglycan-binding domain-containing protein [Deltaproteobacteria bacterium]
MVKSGDTLSGIASRNGVTLSALEAANPQIKNFNLIYPGQTLNLPGGSSSTGTPAPAPSGGTTSTGSGSAPASGKDASAVARQYLGWTEYKLEPSGQLDMDTWVAKNVDCANFVSGCLEKAGLISHAQRSDNVSGLASHLRGAGWQDVPLANAKPGDVVCFDGPEGNYQHVEIFDHWQGSTPVFIGSNNVLSDGTQEITYDVGGRWAHGFHVLAPPA